MQTWKEFIDSKRSFGSEGNHSGCAIVKILIYWWKSHHLQCKLQNKSRVPSTKLILCCLEFLSSKNEIMWFQNILTLSFQVTQTLKFQIFILKDTILEATTSRLLREQFTKIILPYCMMTWFSKIIFQLWFT